MNATARSSLLAALAILAGSACARNVATPGDPQPPSAGTDAQAAPTASPTAPSSSAPGDPSATSRTAGVPAPAVPDGGASTAPAAVTAPPPATVAAPPPAPFRFVTWGDTKVASGASTGAVLRALSDAAKALSPPAAFTLYLGDLEETGFNPAAGFADLWIASLNGSSDNGTSRVTFASRGNHDAMDSSSIGSWQRFFDFQGVATRVGAAHYAELDPEMTYSFDYGNAHFVSLDAPGDFPAVMTSRQIGWLDQDLTAAEARGLTHAFLFWHGPIYSVTSGHPLDNAHPEQPIQDLIGTIGRHPIVSAIFTGHEHVLAYSHIGASRFPSIAVPHEFEQFTIGAGGAAFHDPIAGRGDAVVPYVPGFATVDVNGSAFTVTWYPQGGTTPQGTFTFTKGST